MVEFLDEHLQLLKVLVRHKVEFVIVGGYAVIYYGYERLTGDLDLLVNKNNENREKLKHALQEFGIDPDDLIALSKIDFNGLVPMISFGEKPFRVEFLTIVQNVIFSEAFNKQNVIEIDDVAIPVINFEHLILSKMNTGRLKDQADIEELQRINKYRK